LQGPDRAFHLLAEQLQFDRLIEAAQVSERHATRMREYNALDAARDPAAPRQR